jgi:hypothetical protein
VEEKQKAEELWKEQCFQSPNRVLRKEGQPKGGKEVVPVLMQPITDGAAYELYKTRVLAAGEKPLCKDTFVKQKPYNVRICPKQWGLCPHCELGPKLLVQLNELLDEIHAGCDVACKRSAKCGAERNADDDMKAKLHKLRVDIGHYESHLKLRHIQVC